MILQTRLISSLEKVFCLRDLAAAEINSLQLMKGETAAFQLAFKCDTHGLEISCEIGSRLRDYVSVREVGLVPCEHPAMPEDPFILTNEPGLFPNPLLPHTGPYTSTRARWNAFWFTVELPENFKPGVHSLEIRLRYQSAYTQDAPVFEQQITLPIEVLPAVLAPQEMILTHWFYADCLMTHYKVNCWSEEHWRIIGNFMRNMAAHDLNMVLTPLWTVPLDTDVGSERPTTQLLQINYHDGRYEFDFSLLERWLDLAFASGLKYIEFSHICTQWGAAKTPKILVEVDGKLEKRFGWHAASDSAEYREFLAQLLPQLLALIERRGIREQCYFHISDEPQEIHLEHYREISRYVAQLLPGCKIIDALSEVSFFREGACRCPVPCITDVEHFLGEPVPERWVYYCGNYQRNLPNRQFGMASVRNRITGFIFYVYEFDAFLNWGYNFWYSRGSRRQDLNPYLVTDAGRAFCGGGSFVVYPGTDGEPVDSIHYEVFREALQDLRALKMLERKIGREQVLALLNENLEEKLSLSVWPNDPAWLLARRQQINRLICS